MIEVSEETAEFLVGVLSGLTLKVGAPDFGQAAQSVIKALKELRPPA